MNEVRPSGMAVQRNKMICAAAELLTRRSLQSVTVSDIVGAARLDHSHFFAEFSNSDELYSAAADLFLRRELRPLLKREATNPPETANRELIVRRDVDDSQNGRGSYLTRLAVEAASQPAASALRRVYETTVMEILPSLSDQTQSDHEGDQHVILAAMLGTRLLADAIPASVLGDAVRQSMLRWVETTRASAKG